MDHSVAELTLAEIARRISTHLRRLEGLELSEIGKLSHADRAEYNSSFWAASSFQNGGWVAVTYVSYHGHTNLTKAEALHYLAALDGGFVGRHRELFRESPPPEPEASAVLFTALVLHYGAYRLYAVTKRTEKRVYGSGADGGFSMPEWLDRDKVLKLQATEEDLAAIRLIEKERDAAIEAAHARFSEALNDLIDGDNGSVE